MQETYMSASHLRHERTWVKFFKMVMTHQSPMAHWTTNITRYHPFPSHDEFRDSQSLKANPLYLGEVPSTSPASYNFH